MSPASSSDTLACSTARAVSGLLARTLLTLVEKSKWCAILFSQVTRLANVSKRAHRRSWPYLVRPPHDVIRDDPAVHSKAPKSLRKAKNVRVSTASLGLGHFGTTISRPQILRASRGCRCGRIESLGSK